MTSDFEPVDLGSLGLDLASNPGTSVAKAGFDPSVEVFLDPVCPYSYLAFTALHRLAKDQGLTLVFHPLLLAGSDPLLSSAEARMHAQKQEVAWPALRRLAISSFGLDLRSVDWGARGAVALAHILWVRDKAPQLESRLWRGIFEARFKQGQDIDQPAVVRDIVSGIDSSMDLPDETRLADDLDMRSASLRRSARIRSVTVVPTLIFGGGHVVVGALPEAVLRETLEQLRIAASLRSAIDSMPNDASSDSSDAHGDRRAP